MECYIFTQASNELSKVTSAKNCLFKDKKGERETQVQTNRGRKTNSSQQNKKALLKKVVETKDRRRATKRK